MKKIIILISLMLSFSTIAATSQNKHCKFDSSNMVVVVKGVERYISGSTISPKLNRAERGKLKLANTIFNGQSKQWYVENEEYEGYLQIPLKYYGEVDLYEICYW